MSTQVYFAIIEWLLAIYLGLKITEKLFKAYFKLFDTTPPGQSKELHNHAATQIQQH